ncbi:PaaI family thioesterase [Bradyrhizobium sp. CW7]|uniref:PaaI family thioesterase n=1 Tax=Bradyrhizobium sp. CW7 TaxID=2782688 RepID=UPI001FF7A4F8|nr:PaaI family thioesterase [Bradyrhizobium sp. CW7]MCK1352437.1 PaaI family thioesterase [Bradyrhizobium sp. CW7]
MIDISKSALLTRSDLQEATEGEFKGWRTWTFDTFLNENGPFWHRVEADRSIRCAFRAQKKHLNSGGNVHGGCFMAFVDYSLFAIAGLVLDGPGVTVSLSSEFLDAAHEDELIEATGEVTRAGGSLIFVRGELKSGERLLLTFSGTIKRVKQKPRTIAASRR